jgi:cytochrome c oxidase subunit 3
VTTAEAQAHGHAHDHEHPEYLAHHFDSAQQQFEAGKLGMWLFLATEVLLFGGLFCAYAIWRYHNPEMFRFGSEFLDTKMGAINTAVLILSSLTMATAVTMAQMNKQRELIICLVLTLAGAFGFLGIKYFEYKHKFVEGYFPGVRFYEKHEEAHTWDRDAPVIAGALTTIDATQTAPTAEEIGLPEELPVEMSAVGPAADAPAGLDVTALDQLERGYRGAEPADDHADDGHAEAARDEAHHVHPMQDPRRPENIHMFFNIYFMMTGLHGVHVLMGAGVIIWLLVKAARGRFSSEYFTPVDLGGLYWHVVDLIWIFLFPLFYLI